MSKLFVTSNLGRVFSFKIRLKSLIPPEAFGSTGPQRRLKSRPSIWYPYEPAKKRVTLHCSHYFCSDIGAVSVLIRFLVDYFLTWAVNKINLYGTRFRMRC